MRLPLASSIQTRDGLLSKDAKLVNCFVDVDGETSFVVKRPGLIKAVASTAGTGLGMISWEGNMYHATGSSIYQTLYSSIVLGSGSSSISSIGDTTLESSFLYPEIRLAQNGAEIYMSVCIDSLTIRMYKSTDSGATFSQLTVSGAVGDFGVPSALVYKSGYIYLFNTSGECFRAAAGTAAFTRLTISGPGGSSLIPACVDASYIYIVASGVLYRTADGISYTMMSTIATITGSSAIRGIYIIGGVFYALYINGTTPTIYTSPDGITWTPHSVTGISVDRYCALISNGTGLQIAKISGSSVQVYSVSMSTYACTLLATFATPSGYTSPSIVCIDSFVVGGNSRFALDLTSTGTSLDHALILSVSQSSYTAPSASYSYTTATPGLPLSWVGTSPGTSVKRLFIKNTEKAWTLTLGTPGTLTQVTDVDYPAVTVPGAVYLDGYFFVMDKDGTIYNCDLEDPTSWNSLDYITAEAEWDKGVAIAKHQNYVVALKDWTTELFYDAANPTGSPLSKVSNATIQLGCAQGYSAVQFNGGLVFMSKTREKGRSVHFFAPDSIAPTEIASPAVQRVLNKADLTTVTAWGGKLAGRVLYVLNLVTADITLVYDFSTQTWAQWTSDTSGVEGHFKCGFYATDGSRDYLLHESTGDIFSLTPDAYQDNGANIDVLIRTGRIDGGNMDRKTMHALTVVGDQATTNVTVQYSDDDYQTFSSARTVSMNDSPARLTRLGMFRRRSFDIRHVDNTPLRLMAIDAEMKQAR